MPATTENLTRQATTDDVRNILADLERIARRAGELNMRHPTFTLFDVPPEAFDDLVEERGVEERRGFRPEDGSVHFIVATIGRTTIYRDISQMGGSA